MNSTLRNTLIFTLLVSMAGMAAAADAQTATQPKKPSLFAQADADHDGKLNEAEFAKLEQLRQSVKKPDFKTLDKDGDGAVTRDEMMAARHAMAGNKMMKHGQSLYIKADANQDGQLDQAEYSKLLQLRKERQAKIEAATPDFATLDSNKDGKISKEEMRAGMKTMHEKLRVAE